MCGLHTYNKHKYKSSGEADVHGGWPQPEDSDVNPLVYTCVTINFIDTWINTFEKIISWSCFVYQYKMK